MTRDDLTLLKKRFSTFCKSFYVSDAGYQKNISLKEEHTFHVCKNIVEIATCLSLNDEKILLAESIALFHDIGRFPQYARYKTFRDSLSVNHGLLGAETLIKEKILHDMPSDEQEIIVKSVKFHNAFSISKTMTKEIVFFLKLIRDADKLDIWRVFLEYYESPDEIKASAVGLGLPDFPEYSEEVVSCIFRKKIVLLSMMKTLNDFKLLQLSWIFDLNFEPTFRLLCGRNYVNRLTSHLPQTAKIRSVAVFLHDYIKTKIPS
jgi:hypothetical protein